MAREVMRGDDYFLNGVMDFAARNSKGLGLNYRVLVNTISEERKVMVNILDKLRKAGAASKISDVQLASSLRNAALSCKQAIASILAIKNRLDLNRRPLESWSVIGKNTFVDHAIRRAARLPEIDVRAHHLFVEGLELLLSSMQDFALQMRRAILELSQQVSPEAQTDIKLCLESEVNWDSLRLR